MLCECIHAFLSDFHAKMSFCLTFVAAAFILFFIIFFNLSEMQLPLPLITLKLGLIVNIISFSQQADLQCYLP